MLPHFNHAPGTERSGRFTAGWLVALLFLLGSAAHLSAQTVMTYGFEDGTADGWTSFNGASTPMATTADAYAGTHSLLTTTGSSGSGGPAISLNTVLQAGAQYTITGYVKLTSGEAAGNANFTIRRTDPSCSGGTCYDTVGMYQVAVTSGGWAQIGGSYTASATETGLTLYAQLVGASSAQGFYLDQVVITQTAPPPGGTPVASYTFKDGGLDGWTPLGGSVLTNVASPIADPNGDMRSLEVTNRSAASMGPSLNLLNVNGVVAGATYQVTAYVLLASPDSTNPTASLSIQSADCADPAGAASGVASSGTLSSTTWTKVQGTFSFSDQPGPPTQLGLSIQSSSSTDNFYVSGVTISQVAPPPLNPSQQDNSGISSTFEDGGTDGWSGRAGATVANTTDTAHTGTHSLLTTGRTANYDGPQINVSNKMYPGSLYNLSVWVKLAVNDNSQHVINMSLQTTYQGNVSYPGVSAYPGVTVPADGQWHQISVMNYSMASQYDAGAAFLYLQTVPAAGTDLVSFYIDDFQLSYVAPPTIQQNIPSIYQTLADYFPIGAATDTSDLTGPHAQLLMKHFNSMTPGNDLKWSSVEPALGTYDYTNGDALVGEAVCNASRVRGQNLVWATGAQTPSYAFGDGTNSAANQATVTANIQEHIKAEVQHYANKVYAWDVINEPIDPSQPDCLERGPFYNVLGEKYIDVAFRAARKYAPAGTLLFMNEYSTADPDRLACLVKVIDGMKSRGVPIDGLGHESHESINYPSVSAVETSIDTIHQNFPTLKQQITEFDLSVYDGGDITANYGNNIPPAVLAEQGWLYKQYFDLFRKEKGANKISAVTIWGMADDDTWLDSFPVTRTDYPLPFDMQLQAKPAYWGIVDATKLPGYGLTFSVASKSRDDNKQGATFTVQAQNGDAGVAYTTQINGFTVTQVEGQTCKTTVTPSTLPVSLGDIPTGKSATTSFDIATSGCSGHVRFAISVPWSSAVYHTGTLVKIVGFDVKADKK